VARSIAFLIVMFFKRRARLRSCAAAGPPLPRSPSARSRPPRACHIARARRAARRDAIRHVGKCDAAGRSVARGSGAGSLNLQDPLAKGSRFSQIMLRQVYLAFLARFQFLRVSFRVGGIGKTLIRGDAESLEVKFE
jgi:hypothetical protein